MANVNTTSPNTNPAPRFKDIELVSAGWVNKYILTYTLPNGDDIQYESVSRKGLDEYRSFLEAGNVDSTTDGESAECKRTKPDGVCIVPILPDDSYLLIREFRYPLNGWVIAFPAGLMEEGETIRDCIDRELMEETGYRVRQDYDGDPIILLPQSGYSSAGMSEENVQVALVHVEPYGEAHLEDREFIETFTLPRNRVSEFLETNEDFIGTRAQLLLECMRRTYVLRQRLALALDPLTKEDFA